MIALVLAEIAATDIPSIQCIKDCDPNAGLRAMVTLAVSVSVLVAGALIMPRWRDMIFVAAVSAAAGYLAHLVTFLLFGVVEVVDTMDLLVMWAVCLLAAFAIHGFKRAVLWLAGYRVAAPT